MPFRNLLRPGPVPEVQATIELVEEELSKLYWDSVRLEARNMIQFYETLLESDFDLNLRFDAELCKESFKKMFNVWVGCQSHFDETSLGISGLYKETIGRAVEHLNVRRCERAARLVLQASGLLDMDVLYEPTNGSQRCLRVQPSQPQLELVGDPRLSIRGITCSHCELLIKSNAYYQCVEGCESSHFYFFTAHTKEAAFHDCADRLACTGPQHRAPYRLCSVCTTTVSPFALKGCDLEHLELRNHSQPDLADSSGFSAKLGKLESIRLKSAEKKPESNYQDSFEARFAEIAVQASVEGTLPIDPRIFMRTVGLMVKGHFAPSGNFHLCLMFGPLIFESGLEKIKHGVRACPRPPPAFFGDGGVGELDDDWRARPCPFFYQDRNTKKLEIDYQQNFKVEPRPILACTKRVYGAAFSGYPESSHAKEYEVIKCLIREADRLRKIPKEKSPKARTEQLHKSADALTAELKSCIGPEVKKHLSRIARILFEKRHKNDWSILAHNCQQFVNRLLGGEDFEYMIPQLPKDLKEESFTWPRYLISFGNHIEGFGKSFYQPNGLITAFSQSMPTVDCDVVEYLGSAEFPEESPLRAIKTLGLFTNQPSPSNGTNTNDLDVISRLADHLWKTPGDSLSLLQFHFLRPPRKYGGGGDNRLLADETAWNRHRFLVMTLLDIFASFTGALGNSLYSLFSRDQGRILSKITLPPARVLGNVCADETPRILDQLGPRWVFYEIRNRVPNAMDTVVKDRWRPFRSARVSDDPVHGEQVVSRIVAWPLWIVSLISPGLGAGIGGIMRLHEHNWVSTKLGERTYIRQYGFKKARSVR